MADRPRNAPEVDLFATEFPEEEPVAYLDAYGADLTRWPDRTLPMKQKNAKF